MLSQIQPHFLYNALGTISHLCKHDPVDAQKAIQEFSAFLRGNMDSLKDRGPRALRPGAQPCDELPAAEQRRFQSRLKVVYEIQATGFFIPPLSLQPLVENAVRHGILQKDEGGVLTIRAWEGEEDFFAAVGGRRRGLRESRPAPRL